MSLPQQKVPRMGPFICLFLSPLTKTQGPLLWFLQSAPKPFTSGKWPADISCLQWNNLLSYSYLQSVPRAQITVLTAAKLQEQLESKGDFMLSTLYSLLPQPTQMCTWRCVLQCLKMWIMNCGDDHKSPAGIHMKMENSEIKVSKNKPQLCSCCLYQICAWEVQV